MNQNIDNCKLIYVPKIADVRGNLAVIENGVLPFDFKRVYYLFDVPSGADRGGHSHIEQHEFLLALSGSFDVVIDDGISKGTITLNKPDFGLHICAGIWRSLHNFSAGSVCLVIASDVFKESDYIREYSVFKSLKNS